MKTNSMKQTPWLLLVVSAFMVVYFLFADFDIRYMYVYFTLGVLLCVNVGLSGINKLVLTPYKKIFIFMAATCTVFSVLPNANLSHLSMSLTISMLTFTAYFMFMEPAEKQVLIAFNMIQAASVLFALYTIAVRIWPAFYWNHILPKLSPVLYGSSAGLILQGYGVPIGGSAIYSSYVMTLALIINLSKVLKPGVVRTKRELSYIIVSSILFFVAVVIVNRRTELIAMAAVMLGLFICSLKPKNKKDLLHKFMWLIIVVIVAGVILYVLSSAGFMGRHMQALQSLVEMPQGEATPDEVTNGRFDLWKQAVKLFLQKPVFGIGWQQFSTLNIFNHNVHNTYLQWLCETGLVGFTLIFVSVAALGLMTLYRAWKLSRQKASATVRMINFVSLGMQAFLAICNLVDPAFYHLNYFCFYSFSVALAHYAYVEGEREYKALALTDNE